MLTKFTTGQQEDFPLDQKPLKFFSHWQASLISLIAGILYSLSFEPFGLSIFAWFAIAIFYIASFRRQDKGILIYGFIFSLTHLCFSNWFLNQVSWWIPFIISLAYSFLIPLWLYITKKFYWKLIFPKVDDTTGDSQAKKFILPYKKELLFILGSSFLWCFFEWIRFWLYTGYPWDILAVSQANNSARFIASLGGILSVSFIIILVNMSIAMFLEQRLIAYRSKQKIKFQFSPKLTCLLISLIITLIAILSFPSYQNKKFIKVALLQGDLSPYTRNNPADVLQTYQKLVKESSKEKPDLYIWPETSFPSSSVFDINKYLQQLINSSKAPHIIGSIDRVTAAKKTARYNSAKFYSYPYKETTTYHKVHLVPYGEYIPFKSLITGSLRQTIERTSGMGKSLSRGKQYQVFSLANKQLRLGVQICFEDLFPNISRELIYKNANALLVISNDAWYKNTSGGLKHRTQAIFRAIETNLPLIRVGNHCESALISPAGKIVTSYKQKYNKKFGRGYLIIKVPIIENYHPTFYIRNPYFFTSLMLIVSITIFIFLLYHFVNYKIKAYEAITKK